MSTLQKSTARTAPRPPYGGFLVEVDAYAYQEPAGEWMVATAEDAAGKKYDFPLTIKSPDPLTVNVADDVVFSNLKSKVSSR